MIAYVKGSLESIGEDNLTIENNSIGYEIRIPSSLIPQLPSIGDDIKIFTYLYVREDAMQLYGFISEDDLNVFKLLLTVSGIGPKGALGILSALSADQLRYAILTNDDVLITQAPGVGKKTAQRLIIDLKDKLKMKDIGTKSAQDGSLSSASVLSSDMLSESVQALISLGYSSSEALKVTKSIVNYTSVEDILKQALKQLARL